MGQYAINAFGANATFDYNEVYETPWVPDSGGASACGKWWGTLNANIEGDAFVDAGQNPGETNSDACVWLDNGNTGYNIGGTAGNYFYWTFAGAIEAETAFNGVIANNLVVNANWLNGQGVSPVNEAGAIEINQSGGFNVPGSRYENEIMVSGNTLTNPWEGVVDWQSGNRSCLNSGEGNADGISNASYCTGGFPNSATMLGASTAAYTFSHYGSSTAGGQPSLAAACAQPCSTLLTANPIAVNDMIGFADPADSTTGQFTNVSSFTGVSGNTLVVGSTTGFTSSCASQGTASAPSQCELRVQTSANPQTSYTGAILSYLGTSAGTTFDNVKLITCTTSPVGACGGSGTLAGDVQAVQPYHATGETCYQSACVVSVSPSVTTNESAGQAISVSGTCQLFDTATALPTAPLAPDGVSYYDGCQWKAQGITVTGNASTFNPTYIAATTPPNYVSGPTGTVCTSSNGGNCGVNLQATQQGSNAPYNTPILANAMASCASFSSPFTDLNGASPWNGAPASNGESQGCDIWSGNTYSGPWLWYVYSLSGGAGPVSPWATPVNLSGGSSNWSGTASGDWQQD
jgi:hypothetical protein